MEPMVATLVFAMKVGLVVGIVVGTAYFVLMLFYIILLHLLGE